MSVQSSIPAGDAPHSTRPWALINTPTHGRFTGIRTHTTPSLQEKLKLIWSRNPRGNPVTHAVLTTVARLLDRHCLGVGVCNELDEVSQRTALTDLFLGTKQRIINAIRFYCVQGRSDEWAWFYRWCFCGLRNIRAGVARALPGCIDRLQLLRMCPLEEFSTILTYFT